MANVPSSVGWMTLDCSAIIALADSADAGPEPDAIAALGTVTLVPSTTAPIWVYSDEKLLFLENIQATLTADGVFIDGDASVPLRFVAPVQSALSNQEWTWSASFSPAAPQSWSAFSITFTGKPGDAIQVGNPVTGPSLTPISSRPVFMMDEYDVSLIPEGAINGDLVLVQNPVLFLYKIEGL